MNNARTFFHLFLLSILAHINHLCSQEWKNKKQTTISIINFKEFKSRGKKPEECKKNMIIHHHHHHCIIIIVWFFCFVYLIHHLHIALVLLFFFCFCYLLFLTIHLHGICLSMMIVIIKLIILIHVFQKYFLKTFVVLVYHFIVVVYGDFVFRLFVFLLGTYIMCSMPLWYSRQDYGNRMCVRACMKGIQKKKREKNEINRQNPRKFEWKISRKKT